jgi:hypothetical protein
VETVIVQVEEELDMRRRRGETLERISSGF